MKLFTLIRYNIHTKGLMILGSFLKQRFAHNKPISLSASICFEQGHGMVDGDSASSTELYALLSAISGVPLKQGIAVTGSVSQMGEIQPVGGVTKKIESFFDICRHKGLTGDQGVVIPEKNVPNLMLKREVVEAVRDGQFHIWPITTLLAVADLAVQFAVKAEAFLFFPNPKAHGLVQDQADQPARSVRVHAHHRDRQDLDVKKMGVPGHQSRGAYGREQAGGQGTPDSRHTVDADDVQGIVIADFEFDPHSVKADGTAGQANEQGPGRRDIPGGWSHRRKARNNARCQAQSTGLARDPPFHHHPRTGSGGTGDHRVGKGQGGTGIGCQRTAGIEVEPAEPEKPDSQSRQRQVVRHEHLARVAFALAQSLHDRQRRQARRQVNHEPAGKIEHPQFCQPAASPDPMGQRIVDEQGPEQDESEIAAELHALGDRTADQGRRDDGEHALEIEAIVKPFRLAEIQEALLALGIQGMTVSEVKGFGRQKGHVEIYRGAEYHVNFVPKVYLMVVVEDAQAEAVVDAIQKAALTGKIGDGKIFLSRIDQVMRIRTRETGESAL